MNLKNIFRFPGILAMSALLAGAAMGLTSCSDDDDAIVGDPFFFLEGAEDGVVVMPVKGNGAADKWTFDGGKNYIVRSNCKWTIEPVDGEMPEWMRVFPLEGDKEGILRFYAVANPLAQVRSAEFRVTLNGGTDTRIIRMDQDPTGPNLTITADHLQLQREGGYSDVVVTANYDWVVDAPTEPWIMVTTDGNKITIGTDEVNDSGDDRVGRVVIRGTGANSNLETVITVTQLYAIYYDDFGWCYTPSCKDNADFADITYWDEPFTVPECWGTQSLRIDKFIEPVKSDNPGWTAVRSTAPNSGSDHGPYTYSRYHYILFGTSKKCAGNICSPAVAAIQGSVNATISVSMAGFCSNAGVREKGNEFWLALLGPGRIVDAKANGKSTAAVMSDQCSIPYNSTGNSTDKAGVNDIQLTQAAKFTIGKDGFFDTEEPTCLEVWKSPESQFSIKVEGMTNQTRLVVLACDADKVTMLNQWAVKNGSYASCRMCFDNYKVVID